MSVMENMRGAVGSVWMQGLFAVIVVSFVGWGLGQDGPKIDSVASVNGSRITTSQLDRAMNWVSRGVRSDAEFASLQQQMLTGLIEKRVLLAEADRLGIEVSGEQVEYALQRMNSDTFNQIIIPSADGILRSLSGMTPPDSEMLFVEDKTYKHAKLERFLDNLGLNEALFRQDVYEYLRVRKVLELASLGVHLPPQEIERAYVEQNTTLSLSWVRIPSTAFLDDVPVSDSEIEALIATTPERVQASYDAQFERRYNAPRKATLRMILLRSGLGTTTDAAVQAKLIEIQAEIDAGLGFEQAARKYSEDINAVDGGALGQQADEQMEPVVADAVFGVEVGQVTQPVKTSRGYAIFLVMESVPAKVTPLEDAQQELAREMIQRDRAPQVTREFAEQVLAKWTENGNAPLELLTPKLLLPTTAPGLSPGSADIPQLGPAPELLAAASSAAAGTVLPQVYTVGADLILAQVTEREDADMSAYDAARPALEQRLLAGERMGFQSAYRDDLLALAEVERYLGATAQP